MRDLCFWEAGRWLWHLCVNFTGRRGSPQSFPATPLKCHLANSLHPIPHATIPIVNWDQLAINRDQEGWSADPAWGLKPVWEEELEGGSQDSMLVLDHSYHPPS